MQKLVSCALVSFVVGCTQKSGTHSAESALQSNPPRKLRSADSRPTLIRVDTSVSENATAPVVNANSQPLFGAAASSILVEPKADSTIKPIEKASDRAPLPRGKLEYQKEFANPVLTKKGILYIPKTLVIQNTITRDVQCDHSLGKMEVNFNLTSSENAFVPTINICTKGDEFGTLEFKYQFNAIGRHYEYQLKSSAVGGLVFEHKTATRTEFLPLTIQRLVLRSGETVYSCQLDTPFEKTTSADNLCPDFKFGKLTLNPDATTVNVSVPDRPSVTIPLFEIGDLTQLAGQNFKSLKRLLNEAPTEEESRKVASRMVNAAGRDAASKKLYFDVLKDWKEAKAGRDDVYYEALCSIGAIESLKLVQPLFASHDCKTLFHAVAPLCRVAQSEAVDRLVISAIEKAYPKSDNFDCKSVVSYGLSYFAKPSPRILQTLRSLSKSGGGSGVDLDWYLRNFSSLR